MRDLSKSKEKQSNKTDSILKCGIIMPIAQMGDYSADHWQEVKNIIIESTELVDDIKFKTEIVSNSDGEINVIHKNIIQNIYNSSIVICDISGRNPNVLFELGMRLTFDKPTILIKDDATDYLFDTGSIEHLSYPKDLRFSKIVEFKKQLARRIQLTYQKSIDDPTYSPFLGSFGEFKVPSLNQIPVSDVQQVILDELVNIRSEIKTLKRDRDKNTVLKSNNDDIERLYKIIFQYIKNNMDYDDARKVLKKEKFLDHLLEFDIPNELLISKEKLIKLIENAQSDSLPF